MVWSVVDSSCCRVGGCCSAGTERLTGGAEDVEDAVGLDSSADCCCASDGEIGFAAALVDDVSTGARDTVSFPTTHRALEDESSYQPSRSRPGLDLRFPNERPVQLSCPRSVSLSPLATQTAPCSSS